MRRNALPHACALPLDAFAAEISLHRVSFLEESDFQPQERIEPISSLEERSLPGLSVSADVERLIVRHPKDPRSLANGTSAYPHEGVGFTISLDEWGQVEFNARYSDWDTGTWWYERSIYNVGWFSREETDRFTTSRPTQRTVERAMLR
ncbi:hypothetical protein [Bremerella volcania]|uniref:hypothetical protein n=1 Tax=Bremerella volcania TaxID=2527984 RepID=UPI0011A3E415|nr:hypothetical protein [Bremerella volcania]